MRLKVTQDNRLVSETQFIKGPIYIGRHPQSQVFLRDRSVSRQHAVFFLTEEGEWMVRDLQSANKTYMNGKAITVFPLKSGDHIKVGDFDIVVDLEEGQQTNKAIHLEDTRAPVSQQPSLVARELDNPLSPPIRMPAHRANDLHAMLSKVMSIGHAVDILNALLDMLIDQFQANRVWCAFRYDPEGYAEEEGGRTHLGEIFVLKNETLKNLLEQACEKRKYILLTHTGPHAPQAKDQSSIIVPILAPDRILGEIYLDSRPNSPPFSMSDLDYAMLLSISLAVILERLLVQPGDPDDPS